MALSKKVWLGVATEATSGVAIATPTVFTPTKAGFKNLKKRVYLSEERGTRDINNAVVDSVRHAEGTFAGSWYNDSSPYFLYAFMGADSPTTPATGVYSHAMTLADIPPSLTLFRAVDNVATYQLPYSVVEKLKFAWAADNKVLEMSGNWQGAWGTKMSSPPPRPADTSLLPFAGYNATIQFGGVSSNDVEEADIELSQKIELWFASNGSQDVVKIYFGDREAKLNFTTRFDSDAFYERYHGATPQDDHVNVKFTGTLISNLQSVSIPGGTTAGTFTLSYKGQTTAGIAYNANASAVQTALQALSTIGATGCTVTGGPGPSTAWVVQFTGALAQDTTLLTGSGSGLTPSGAVTITPTTYPHICQLDFPIVGWDEMDHEHSKPLVQIKAKGTARPGTTVNSLFSATIQNATASYTL